MEKKHSIFIDILRWIAVLPASVVTYVLAYAVSMLIQWINYGYVGIEFMNTISITVIVGHLIVYGFAGYVAMFASAYIAPKAKFITSIIMATLWCIFFIFAAISAFFVKQPLMQTIMVVGGSATSSIGVILYIRNNASSLKNDKIDLE